MESFRTLAKMHTSGFLIRARTLARILCKIYRQNQLVQFLFCYLLFRKCLNYCALSQKLPVRVPRDADTAASCFQENLRVLNPLAFHLLFFFSYTCASRLSAFRITLSPSLSLHSLTRCMLKIIRNVDDRAKKPITVLLRYPVSSNRRSPVLFLRFISLYLIRTSTIIRRVIHVIRAIFYIIAEAECTDKKYG